MNIIDKLKQFGNDNPVLLSVGKYAMWVIIVYVLILIARRFIIRKMPDGTARYKAQKGVEIIGYILIILLSISYFTGNIKDFTLAIGLFTAGIAITLQELILSIAGSLYIFIVKVYKPGDRIEINGIKGDVIDVDSIYTTLMEIGEWVTSDNYSGRIVKLSNAFVFKGPVFNYSQDFPFIWDELTLPIRYGSDMELAKSIITDVAIECLKDFTEKSKKDWEQVVNKYYIEDAEVLPTLVIKLTDNWVEMNLRYIVDYKKRRITKHLLHDTIGKKILETEGKVVLASATYEIVAIPELGIRGTSTTDHQQKNQ
jgi:small-conductance mechanosensitive channel